jgi:hypothetical protein
MAYDECGRHACIWAGAIVTNLRDIFSEALRRSGPLAAALLRKAHGSIAELVKNTDLMTQLADGLHEAIPLPARLFVRREAFVRFVLGNRDALVPLLTSTGGGSDSKSLEPPAQSS